MTELARIPEVAALDSTRELVRIPQELDVPLTPRVKRLIDTAAFRRLARVSQVGLVSLVYPAAIHTRFEHSLGVYRLALLFLKRLGSDGRFAARIGAGHAERLLVAALLHDLGHWPFCHPIEDLGLAEIPPHERLASGLLHEAELARLLRGDWGLEPEAVARLLAGETADEAERLLSSILSSPIDIDKLDYLARDSLHAGVPYGRHFDQGRLVASLCVNAAGDGLAITDKGKTAAEMMVFARYVMFSEVYWHHGVRAATAMLQRAFFRVRSALNLPQLFRSGDAEAIAALRAAAVGRGQAEGLLDGLFGARRRLYKRLAQYSFLEHDAIYQRLTRRSSAWLVRCSGHLADVLRAELGEPIESDELLFDAPPREREIEFKVDVLDEKRQRYRRLDEISPVVRVLAREQFDDYVKRVRVFVAPERAPRLTAYAGLDRAIERAIELTEADGAPD